MKPWGEKEKNDWFLSQSVKRSYFDDVILKLEELKEHFHLVQYGFLSLNPSRYPLYYLINKNFDQHKRTVLITGGVQGYETSGVHGALLFIKREASHYLKSFNFICFPCLSPWSYETINRWNSKTIDPNRSFFKDGPAEECQLFLTAIAHLKLDFVAHFDLHETTDTDNTIFRPAKAARDGVIDDSYFEIPDGFYLVADSNNSQIEFQNFIINGVKKVTAIAPADKDGKIVGEPLVSEGVVLYDMKKLSLCGGFSTAQYTTTTEVYPDGQNMTPATCNESQVCAIKSGLDFLKHADR